MRTWSTCVAMALLLVSSAIPERAAAAEDFKLEGRWKLIFIPEGLELVIFDVAGDDGLKATAVNAFQQLGKVEFKSVEMADGKVSLKFECGLGEMPFKGTPVTEGDDAGAVLGMIRLRGNPLPARLEKTDAEKVSAPKPNPAQQKAFAAIQTKDAKEKVKKLEEVLHDSPGPGMQPAYMALLQSAEAGGLTEDEVRKHVDAWLAGAKPYGIEWVTQSRVGTLQGLQGKKTYANLALELAQQAKKDLAADASLDQQAAVTQALASAAKLADKADLAAEAEAELAVLDAKLDEEYHARVPPFKPEPFAGRENVENDRVVLFELFTGAQCPPCVAADVAFDALLSTYKPTELVTLQYHLHIPGPDPLTNPDAVKRSQYYALRGTPSTYFNGATAAGGGGGMAQSKGKYDQFRAEIDKQLAGAKSAKIELNLRRSGDIIAVIATAKVDPNNEAQEKGDAKEKGKEKEKDKSDSKLHLRVVLTEEMIRYVGGNQLRFHHHVVRSFPGGVEGKELEDGEGQVELTVDLNEVRQGLNAYLDEFASGRGFPAAMPKLDLKGLAIVVFVQDDADKRVLHAVQASVPEAE